MNKEKYKVVEVIFNKCPVCKQGKVQRLKPTGFFSFLRSEETICNTCNVIFVDEGELEGEQAYSIDLSRSTKKNNYEEYILKMSEWKRGESDVDVCQRTNTLPNTKIMGLKIILKPNEKTHYYSGTQLMEERTVRTYSGGHAGFRVMKGVYIGGSRGTSESHGELRNIDDGQLLLTNQRLIFNGDLKNMEYRLDKITSVEQYEDAIEVGSSQRQKVQIFVVDSPHKWATYLKIAVQNSHKQK